MRRLKMDVNSRLAFYEISLLLLVSMFLQRVQSDEGNGPLIKNTQGQPFRAITVALPNMELASKMARELVQLRLAATVNIFPNAVSMYIWQEELQETAEPILLIYTHVNKYSEIEKFIRAHHSYQEPGVVVLPIVGGSATFFNWLDNTLKVEIAGSPGN